MAISGDYPSPVTVNGFQCRNCSDVDRAKRFIDPARPQSGPFGMNDKSKAKAAHFDAAARDTAQMGQLRAARARPVSPVAAAYGLGAGSSTAGAGGLVSLSV